MALAPMMKLFIPLLARLWLRTAILYRLRHVGYVMMCGQNRASACGLRQILLSLAETGRVAAVARDRGKCPGLATNAGRTGVVTRDVS